MALITDPKGQPVVGLRTSDNIADFLALEDRSEAGVALAMLALEDDGLITVVNLITLEDGRRVYAFVIHDLAAEKLGTGMYL